MGPMQRRKKQPKESSFLRLEATIEAMRPIVVAEEGPRHGLNEQRSETEAKVLKPKEREHLTTGKR